MSLTDKSHLQIDGTPVVLRAPVRMLVKSTVPLPPTAMAEAQAAYQAFRNNLALSLLEFAVHREVLPCGVLMTVQSVQRVDSIVLEYSDKRPACLIPLESGIVDLIAVLAGPTARDQGQLYRTDYVNSYIGSQPTPLLAGPLKVPDLIGKPPEDNRPAASFPFDNNPKKLAAAQCPPSMFTGRTRLWIQSLYGAHPAMFRKYMELGSEVGQRPFLRINSIEVNTSTGVYLDPRTHGHWMIRVDSGSVSYYPLRASECGERLRRLLGSNNLSEADKQRVEAYILASSVPVPSLVQTVAAANSYPTEALGYGWHFNYDGTACDIVEVLEITLPEFSGIGGGENRSTHYRLEHFQSLVAGALRWSFTFSVVEGPKRWMTSRSRTAICYPLWGLGVLQKAGIARGAQIPYGDAPFYVFYKKNAVQVCRYATTHSEEAPKRFSTPSYFGGDVPLRTPFRATLGLEGAEWYDTTSLKTDNTIISVGGQQYEAMWRVADRSGERQSEKPENPVDIEDTSAGGGSYFSGVSVEIGAPKVTAYNDINPSVTSTYTDTGGFVSISGARSRRWVNHAGDWYYDTYTARDNRTVRIITIIPFYDAEAAFVHREETTDNTKLVTRQYWSGGIGAWVSRREYYAGPGGSGGPALQITYAYSSGPVSPTNLGQEVLTEGGIVTTTLTRLVTSAAEPLPAAMNMGVEIFFDSLSPVIAQQFATISSTNGAVYAQGKDVKNGVPTNIDNFGPVAFVGWA